MPKATAVWLVENTSLTFDQIAEFCGMHLLEVKGIADGDVGQGVRGKDPITAGELTREEIKRAEADSNVRLRLQVSKVEIPQVKTKRGPRYTPVSRRHDRPNAVLWLLRNHPEMRDSQIIRLVGTTKPTIAQIRDRTHWNSPNLVPQDPVTLGLCTQTDLDNEVKVGAARLAKERAAAGIPMEPAGTLLPTAQTTHYMPGDPQPTLEDDAPPAERPEAEEARILARLKQMSGPKPADEDADDEDAAPAAATSAEPHSLLQTAPASADEAAPQEQPDAAPAGEVETATAPAAKPKTDYLAEVKRYVPDANEAAVAGIVKHLGIALRSTDASLVACSSKDELDRVRESWCKKKLARSESDAELDAAIKDVCETMKADRNKQRVTFYYLLAQKFEKVADLA